ALRVPADEEPMEFYRPAMRHPDPKIRFAAVDVINKILRDKSAAARAIADVLTDPNRGVRLAAVDAQGRVHNPETVATLIRCLDDADVAARRVAMNYLANVKYVPAMPRIAEHLRDDGEAVAAELIKFGPAAENVAIAKAGADSDAKTRLAALTVLDSIGTKASL